MSNRSATERFFELRGMAAEQKARVIELTSQLWLFDGREMALAEAARKLVAYHRLAEEIKPQMETEKLSGDYRHEKEFHRG
jgi:hypothetical protein